MPAEMPNHQALHQAIRVASDPVAVMERIVREALTLIPQADGSSLEVRRDADTLEYLTAAGSLAPYVGLRLPVSESLSGLSVLTGVVQICADAQNDPRVNADAVRKTGVSSMVCMPLSSRSDGIAVLKISSSSVNSFDDKDVRRLEMLARFLAVTIEAASNLASEIADVLEAVDQIDEADAKSLDWQQATARFVANVMTPGLAVQVELEDQINTILKDEAIEIVFQPIVDLAANRILCCEALSRFPSHSDKSPDLWFAAAEQAGLGIELELLAIRKVIALIKDIPPGIRVAVNAGPRAILHPGFRDLIESAPADRLTVELTEHDAVMNYPELIDALIPLRQNGILLSVDDTGSGHSGLNQILRLRPDVIKLDREMVVGIHADPVRRALATALVSFAASIEARVIAEGLEEEDDVNCVRHLGIIEVQGYYYFRPMPLADLKTAATWSI